MQKAKTTKGNQTRLARVTPEGHEMVGWGNGRTAAHRASRDRIMARDHYLCQCDECKRLGRILPAHHVDHVDNRRGPGYEDDANKIAINAECHKAKTALEALIARGLAKRPDWMKRHG